MRLERGRNPIDHRLYLRQLGLRFLVRRHQSQVEHIHDILPRQQHIFVMQIQRQGIEPQIGLLKCSTVTLKTPLRQKRMHGIFVLHIALCPHGRRRQKDERHQNRAEEILHRVFHVFSKPLNVPVLWPNWSISNPKFCNIDTYKLLRGTRLALASGNAMCCP